MNIPVPRIRALGLCDYTSTWREMESFTSARGPHSCDEIWWLEHRPVYTLGRNAKHRAPDNGIPVVVTDRGGDITYHGPGQLVVYPLLDLRRLNVGVKRYVQILEQTVIDLLSDLGVAAARRPGAPGVYVDGRKIASLGLRIRASGVYHGLALNVAMDLTPFAAIAPCGYRDLQVTQICDLGINLDVSGAAPRLLAHLQEQLGYNAARLPLEVASQ